MTCSDRSSTVSSTSTATPDPALDAALAEAAGDIAALARSMGEDDPDLSVG